MHLTPEEFVDVVEGTRTESSFPHLAACAACRSEIAAMRAMLTEAAGVEVPEPSAGQWASLSARIDEAIDSPRTRFARWWASWTSPRVLVPLSAAAVLFLVVAIVPGLRGRHSRTEEPAGLSTVASRAAAEPANDADLAADPMLTLVSDLTASLDLDGASAAGFAERGSAEHAVTHMNGDELRALKQLLQAEMARQGD